MSSIKLEAGKFYRNRDGKKIGPVLPTSRLAEWPFRTANSVVTYRPDGTQSHMRGEESPDDLVAEWTDEPAQSSCLYGSGDCAICAASSGEDEILYASPPVRPLPERCRILNDGAALTNGDRDDEYGPPVNNMSCAGELKAVFRKWLARDISPGELEALDMALTKLSRLACGKPKRDTYVDAATYIAIAGEVALAS